MMKILNIFQIISIFIGLFIFLPSFIEVCKEGADLGMFLISVLFLCFCLFTIYTNLYLLFRKKLAGVYIKYNLWVNFAQILHLTIFNFSYYLTMGLLVMPFIVSNETLRYGLRLDFFNLRFKFFYESGGNKILLGINLIPLLTVIFFELALKKHNNQQNSNEVIGNEKITSFDK